jgi:hypothetical protein
MVVHTRHETTGEWGDFPVTIVRHGEDERWSIKFEDGREFVGTFNHPVMVDEAWVEIQHLKAGDKVLQPEGFAVVKSAKYFDRGPIVKIEVQDAHTYLTEGFLSHNKMMQEASAAAAGAGDFADFGEDNYFASGGLSSFARGGGSHYLPTRMHHRSGLSDAYYNLGGYSDGGRLLRGPGDGVSDSIPAMIGKKQPARLADGEFVVPARIVSELGNGSTEAGARKLYAMMDRIQAARKQTVGKNKVATNTRAHKYLPV